MRYLTCYVFKDENENVVKRCEMLTTKTNNIYLGQFQLLAKLSSDYNLPIDFVERDYDNPNLLGVYYINPKASNSVNELRDIDVDHELELYNYFREHEVR